MILTTSRRYVFFPLLPLLLSVVQPAGAPELVVTKGMHHLRSGGAREWAEFGEESEGRELALAFVATRNSAEQTLRVRHRDLKQPWRIALNGNDVARLPLDEADMLTYWPVPPGTLRDGPNLLRIYSTGKASDDVMVGEVALIERSRTEVLSESSVDVSVVEEPGGRGIPSRITVTNGHGTLVSLGIESGPEHAVRPGVVYTRRGTVRLRLPAGRYVAYAGRGFEYSVARVTMNLAPGPSAARRLVIRREVDTAGWAAMDTHVHTGTHARHGDADVVERMLTLAAEGIELPVSTEHNTRVPFEASASDAGVNSYFTPVTGSEVTTPSLGHFNVFPLGDTAAVDQRSPGWAELRESITRVAPGAVVVLNHARDVHGGFRPFDRARHIGIAGEDLSGWRLPANGMEVINSGAVMTDALALPRDWMTHLNRGVTLAPIGSSDSHDVSRYIVGQGRTYVRCDDRDPGRLNVSEVIGSIRGGRVTVSYGLLVEVDVHGKGPGDLLRPAKDLSVRIRVKGPSWTRARRVALYVNGEQVRAEEIAAGTGAGLKWEKTWQVPKPAHDVHLVAIASGPGVRSAYWPTAKPYQPTSIEFTPYVLGVSGAVFVDADGSGSFDSAFDYAKREVSAASDVPLATRLDSYDFAVAVQAASLLRVQNPSGFEDRIRVLMQTSTAKVARGLQAYLDAWREAQAATGTTSR
jgi:hypothetical protein